MSLSSGNPMHLSAQSFVAQPHCVENDAEEHLLCGPKETTGAGSPIQLHPVKGAIRLAVAIFVSYLSQ